MGEAVFSQGEECSDVHDIHRGVAKLTVVSKRGRGAVLAILGRGDFIGEECIAGASAHRTSAIALVPSSIAVIRRRLMVRLLHRDRAVASRFMNHLLARNLRIEQDLIDHLFNSSEKRLARALVLLARYAQTNEMGSVFFQDQPGHPGRDDRHDSLASELLHEQIQKIGLDSIQWRIASTRLRFFMTEAQVFSSLSPASFWPLPSPYLRPRLG
jgi:hypothetical protein